MVAMNPQTWDKDVREIEPGGYLFYDSTRPMPPSKFRSDINVVGMPLTAICNERYSDPRQRQLFKNIIYVGALAALLGIEIAEVEKLIAEQFRGKDKLIPPNYEALHMGRDYAETHLKDAIGLKVRRADAVGDRIFLEGNDAAALGAVYGGATVAAWYPITPSTSLAEAFAKHCRRFRTDPETGESRYAIVQAEDELVLDRHGDRRRLERRARLHGDLRPRHLADAGVHRPCLFRRGPGGDLRRAARRALDRHADAHAAIRPPDLGLCLPRRHQARAALPGRPARVLRVRRDRLRPRRPAPDAGLRHARPRHRHERMAVRAARRGTTAAGSTAARC